MPGFTGFVAILFSFNCQRRDYTDFCLKVLTNIKKNPVCNCASCFFQKMFYTKCTVRRRFLKENMFRQFSPPVFRFSAYFPHFCNIPGRLTVESRKNLYRAY